MLHSPHCGDGCTDCQAPSDGCSDLVPRPCVSALNSTIEVIVICVHGLIVMFL